jgi:hypothetical protein
MSINMTELGARADVKTVAIHQMAAEAIKAMIAHNAAVGTEYGYHSDEYREQVESFGYCIGQIFVKTFSNHAYVTLDGEMSLFINEGDIFCYGMIFHRNRALDGRPVVPGTWSLHS